jgi:hypothetical protein
MKKLSFWLILLVFLYGFTEAAAWVGYRVLFGERFSFSRLDEVREKTIATLAMDVKQAGKSPAKLLHPYYGFIPNPNWVNEYRRESRLKDGGQLIIDDPINSYGFIGATEPVQPRDPGTFVVAITGGSVAAYAAAWGRETLLDGLRRIPAIKGRKIVLLNLGAGAYKQPQQVMVIGDILSQGGQIDLLINLDGFNEIALPRGSDTFASGVSPYFPQNWKLLSETNYSRDSMVNLGHIAILQEDRARWVAWAARAPWRYSVTAATVWRIMDGISIKQQVALEQKLAQNTEAKLSGSVPTTADLRTSLGPPDNLKDARGLYEASASLWARASMLLNNMVAAQNGLYVHVLQPNQYFPGSRPIGADDPKLTLSPESTYKPEVERGYPYLRSAGQALVRSGIRFYDLTALFKDDPAPVYGDNCCHFTREGNTKLVRAIITRVAETVRKDPAPHAVSFITFDYRLETLRSLALQREGYSDGSGVALKRPPAASGH